MLLLIVHDDGGGKRYCDSRHLKKEISFMAYNRRNFLHRVLEVQDAVLKEKKHGTSQIWVYENIVKDRFLISFSTFNRYLSINAKREIKKYE